LDSRVTLRKEKFRSPSFGTVFDGSAEKLRSIPKYPDASPPSSNFGNIADEDMWMSMNKGHITTDLDYLQCTPNGNCSSVPSEISSVSFAINVKDFMVLNAIIFFFCNFLLIGRDAIHDNVVLKHIFNLFLLKLLCN
jgi:hypothetical protein